MHGVLPVLFAAIAIAGFVGCNIQWLPVNPVVPDPNPPGPVVINPQFRLLIVEETADRPSLPAGQQGIFTSVALRESLDAWCAKLGDGSAGYRIVDVDDLSNVPVEFREVASKGRPQVPWLFCTNGKSGLSCPLPATVDELLSKVEPYAKGAK